MDFETLSVTKADYVATVEMRGTAKGNAMGPALFDELPRAFDALSIDDEVRAIVLKGSGEHFTYGLDLKGMMSDLGPHLAGPQSAGPRMKLLALIEKLQNAMTSVARCSKPVVASLTGWCIGGGVDLSSACDIRVCSQDARFSVREVKLAIVADIGTLQRLPHVIGEAHTRELALTGRDIDAEEALRIGLVTRVLESQAASHEAAHSIAKEIAGNPPLTVMGIKRVMNHRRERDVADGLAYVAAWNAAFLQSDDLSEAIMAFMQKRAPSFKGA